MSVVVSSDNTVSVVVVDGPAVAVDVSQTQQASVDAYGGIGPTIVVTGSATSVVGTVGVNPFIAGPNITITTAGGSITVIGADTPTAATIPSVLSPTEGDDLESLADDIQSLRAVDEDVIQRLAPFASTTGIPLVSGASGRIATATSYVSTVMGRTGDVTLSVGDVTGAGGARCALIAGQPVGTVDDPDRSIVMCSFGLWDNTNQRPWLYASDDSVYVHPNYTDGVRDSISAAPAFHTHSTTQITNFTASITAIVPVLSVNAKTGDVVVTQFDIPSEFGNNSVFEDFAQIFTSVSEVESRFPNINLPSNKGLVSGNDGVGGRTSIKTSSGFVHTLNSCTGSVTIVGGPSISISPSPSLGRITISYTGGTTGGGGGGGGVSIWPSIIFGG